MTLKTTHRSVVALPYNFELHDIVLMALGHHPSGEMYRRVMDQFECLYAESAERPKIMAIAMHPYLSGVPHRINHVRRAFEDVLSRPGVARRPHTPEKCAGTRMLPPKSVPRPSGEPNAATSAASPPLLPPGVRARSHGLFVRP